MENGRNIRSNALLDVVRRHFEVFEEILSNENFTFQNMFRQLQAMKNREENAEGKAQGSSRNNRWNNRHNPVGDAAQIVANENYVNLVGNHVNQEENEESDGNDDF
jgi:hypothetical protein